MFAAEGTQLGGGRRKKQSERRQRKFPRGLAPAGSPFRALAALGRAGPRCDSGGPICIHRADHSFGAPRGSRGGAPEGREKSKLLFTLAQTSCNIWLGRRPVARFFRRQLEPPLARRRPSDVSARVSAGWRRSFSRERGLLTDGRGSQSVNDSARHSAPASRVLTARTSRASRRTATLPRVILLSAVRGGGSSYFEKRTLALRALIRSTPHG